MSCDRNVTCPSMNTTFAPAPWKLKISSLGPQCVLAFQTQVLGPPSGSELLLMARFKVAFTSSPPRAVKPVAGLFGAPFTPNPLSASIQRQKARKVSPLGSLRPIGSG